MCALAPDANQLPVISLVKEVAGLLAPFDIGFKLQTVFKELDWSYRWFPKDRRAVAQNRGQVVSDSSACSQHDPFGVGEFYQRLNDGHQVRDPNRRVKLYDQRVVVAVNDQSGQAIVFTMHQSEGGCVVVVL
jgi:hypothetical protein